MGKARTVRDHDKAIAAVRAGSRRFNEEAASLPRGSATRGGALLMAAALSFAGDMLDGITGKLEREAKKSKARGRARS